MNSIGLFAKYWQPGKVKTRLAASIGASVAADFYQQMLRVTLDRLSDVGDVRQIVFTPTKNQEDFASLNPKWQIQAQSLGDLGSRLENFFANQFTLGATKVIAIGGDCPQISSEVIEDVWTQLEQKTAVWGPAHDGGYYLIGLSQMEPSLFREIDWSTPKVLAQSIARANVANIAFALARESYDVDDLKSLTRFVEDFATSEDVNLARLAQLFSKSVQI